MATESLGPEGFISQYALSNSAPMLDFLDLDSNDNIYLHATGTPVISGNAENGQVFSKVETDPTNANFGLLKDLKLIKLNVTGGYGSRNGFCVSGSYIHGGQLNYQNNNAYARNYCTNFRTDLNFSNITTLNSWNCNETYQYYASNQSFPFIAGDGSGGAYLVVYYDQGNTYDVIGQGVIKVNSSGTQQWKRFINGLNNGTLRARTILGFHANSSNYWSMCGRADGSAVSGNDGGYVGLFNSSGTQQWLKLITNGNYYIINGTYVDSSQNVYIVAQNIVSSGGYNTTVSKFNSSGTHQWSRTLSLDSDHQYPYGITVHGSDVWVAIQWTENPSSFPAIVVKDKLGILKLDTSGNYDWYREIKNSVEDYMYYPTPFTNPIRTDSQGNLLVRFTDTSSARKDYLMKIPNSKAVSGAFTGSYFNSAISISSRSGSFSSFTPSVSNWHSSTTSPYTLTGSNASLTSLTPTAGTNTTTYL